MTNLTISLPTLHHAQAKIWKARTKRNVVRCGRRFGKALALDTPIPTPSGWTTMKELVVGDVVYDEMGQPCTVTFVTEVQFKRPCNKVTFSDGTSIIADDDHQWLTWCTKARSRSSALSSGKQIPQKMMRFYRKMPKVRSTRQLREDGVSGPGGYSKFSIASTKPIEAVEVDFPIDPYVLGLWLGDGSTNQAVLAIGDEDAPFIVSQVEAAGEPIKKLGCKFGWSLSDGVRHVNKPSSFRVRLIKAGLFGKKHIPPQLLRGSVEQRLSLLQGLMDSDGSTSKGGASEFANTNENLSLGVLELCRSLGIHATYSLGKSSLNGHVYGPIYRVNFSTDLPIFRLPRKLARINERKTRGCQITHRFIRSIIPVPSVPVRCIQVNSPSSLFLAGEAMIPTHNTKMMVTLAGDASTKSKRAGLFAPQHRQLSEPYIELKASLKTLLSGANRNEGLRLTTGGQVDCWHTDDNELAGRGGEYDLIEIDEGAFTKNGQMMRIWEQNLVPTMATKPNAEVWVFSTPCGTNEENFFWQLCNNPEHGFKEHYAPSWANPLVSKDWIELERKRMHPDVFRQEIMAEFVNWSGTSFFNISKMLVDDHPVAYPTNCDRVFAVIDTAIKTGSKNDGTAVGYYARSQYAGIGLILLDWEIVQVEGALLDTYLKTILARCVDLATQCKAREGSLGAFIEDKASGQVLLQQARRNGWPVQAIGGAWMSMGKDERAIEVSSYHHQGLCKISGPAFEKTVTYKGATKNHFTTQVEEFRLGDPKAATRADDLLDMYVHALALSFAGNTYGM